MKKVTDGVGNLPSLVFIAAVDTSAWVRVVFSHARSFGRLTRPRSVPRNNHRRRHLNIFAHSLPPLVSRCVRRYPLSSLGVANVP